MISALGREVATTCQYWPAAGSFVTEASPEAAGPTGAGFDFTGATGDGLTDAGLGAACSGCVVAGSDAAGLVSGGVAGGSCADAGGFELEDCASGASTGTVFPLLCAASAAGAAELRPTMYPMEKNTPKRTTTIRKTLMSCRFPRINSNSPSSLLAKIL